MTKIEYVGRTAKFLGKTLPQICLKLKDFGVGRMFVRHRQLEKYPEVSYYVLTKFEANMNDPYLRQGNFRGHVYFRGGYYGEQEIPGSLEDFQLIAKEDEKLYKERTLPAGQKWRQPTVVPKFVELPPLMKELLKQEARELNVEFKEDELKLPYVVDSKDPFSLVKYEN